MKFESPQFETQAAQRSPERFRSELENLEYDGISWKQPRSIIDILSVYIQRGMRVTTAPEYAGLLDAAEKNELQKLREDIERVWGNEKINPQERIAALKENRWNDYALERRAGVAGDLFVSDALRQNPKAYNNAENRGRLSFSLNITKADKFFDYMLTQLSRGELANIPIQFKMGDVSPEVVGNGENAHLYFSAEDEDKVYAALTEKIYPALEKNEYISLGGRFFMIPVQDKNGKTLRGIEFGQGMRERNNMQLPKREERLKVSRHGELATSGVIADVLSYISDELPHDVFERLKKVFEERGKNELVRNKEFLDANARIRKRLIEMGRDPTYPIVDRDYKKAFPNFTNAIN